MIKFDITKKSKLSKARIGILKTSNGEVETPCLVTVATQAVVKTLTSEEIKQVKSQILIANTFHLHLRPGETIVKKMGGLHRFMNWKGPIMTDSGGFQVFSLGFGKDFGIGKALKVPLQSSEDARFRKFGIGKKSDLTIKTGQQPKLLKITKDGVFFRSFVDGKEIFMGPKESIKIQEKLGADIIFAFDECTPPLADYNYTKTSLLKTHEWAKVCLNVKKLNQSLFGIVQGGKFKDLRVQSAKFIGGLDFDGFGIGGEFGDSKETMSKMLNWTLRELPEKKPRHLLGIGHLEDIPEIIKLGVDTFDCIAPTHYARRGVVFTSEGKINMEKSIYMKDKSPLDKKCDCYVCQNYTRAYIAHLLRAREITPLKLITFHNLYYYNTFIEKIREQIKKGKM